MTLYLCYLCFISTFPKQISLRMSNYNDKTITDIMMHHTLTKRIINLEKNHQRQMMKLKILVQGLHLIKTYHKQAKTLFLSKQVSNTPIEIYIMYLIYFYNFNSLISFILIFIEHQSHRSSENNPERNYHYRKALSTTNDFRGPQPRS